MITSQYQTLTWQSTVEGRHKEEEIEHGRGRGDKAETELETRGQGLREREMDTPGWTFSQSEAQRQGEKSRRLENRGSWKEGACQRAPSALESQQYCLHNIVRAIACESQEDH